MPTITRFNTRREAAKAAGVGVKTYDAGKLILDAAEAKVAVKVSAKLPTPLHTRREAAKAAPGRRKNPFGKIAQRVCHQHQVGILAGTLD